MQTEDILSLHARNPSRGIPKPQRGKVNAFVDTDGTLKLKHPDGSVTSAEGGGVSQEQLDAGLATRAPVENFTGSNVLFVSKGEAATDTREGLSPWDSTRPFATIGAAQSAALVLTTDFGVQTVVVMPGDWTSETGATPQEGVNIFAMNGALLDVSWGAQNATGLQNGGNTAFVSNEGSDALPRNNGMNPPFATVEAAINGGYTTVIVFPNTPLTTIAPNAWAGGNVLILPDGPVFDEAELLASGASGVISLPTFSAAGLRIFNYGNGIYGRNANGDYSINEGGVATSNADGSQRIEFIRDAGDGTASVSSVGPLNIIAPITGFNGGTFTMVPDTPNSTAQVDDVSVLAGSVILASRTPTNTVGTPTPLNFIIDGGPSSGGGFSVFGDPTDGSTYDYIVLTKNGSF